MNRKNEKIKIVHLGYMHKYADTRIFEKECKSLQSLENTELYFVTSNRNGNFDGESIDGIHIKTIPLIRKRYIKLLYFIKALKEECMQIDANIYHVHEFILLPMIPYLKKKGKKVVYDKHEDTFNDVYSKAEKTFGERIGRKIANSVVKYERKNIERSNGYIYVTPQHEIKGLKTPNYLIPNYPKIDLQTTNNSIIKKRERFTVAYCGGISPIWNLKSFSDILKKRRDIDFVMAGPGAKSYIEEIKKDDYANCVSYLGKIPFKEVSKVYETSHVGVALLKKNLGEVIGEYGTLANTKIFEYMKSGLPVIFTNFPIWEEICKEYKFGISVDINSPDSIETALSFLMKNPIERKLMAEEGKRAIKEKYNWGFLEEKLLALYKIIIEEETR